MEEEEQSKIIRRNVRRLKLCIRTKVEALCEFLCQKELIAEPMKEGILCEETPCSRASKLLYRVSTLELGGVFYEACKHHGLKDAADILRPDKAPHQIVASTGAAIPFQHKSQPLPDKWPSEEHFKRVRDNLLTVKTVPERSYTEMDEIYKTHLEKTFIYPMYHKCRGNALIINIDKFEDQHLPKRDGSKWDVQGFQQLFHGLGFHIKSGDDYNNLSKDEIDNVIASEVESDHQNHDCFVLVFMSHGRAGSVFDKYGVAIQMQSIVDQFRQVKDLQDKPKLFFFQACQGEQITHEDYDDKDLEAEGGAHPSSVTVSQEQLVSRPDMFIFNSSPPGVRSVRNTEWGSWFCQAVIYVFSEFSYCCHFEELQSKVHNLVATAEPVDKYLFGKNVSELTMEYTTKLYFFPGLYEEN